MTLKLAVTVGASVTTTRADAAALLSTVVLVDPAVWDPGTVLGSGVGAAVGKVVGDAVHGAAADMGSVGEAVGAVGEAVGGAVGETVYAGLPHDSCRG